MTTPNGLLANRFCKTLMLARGDLKAAEAYIASQRWLRADAILDATKAAIGAINPDSAPQLLAPIGQDLLALVRPLSIFERLVGFRRIPPQTALLTQTNGAVGYWGDTYGGSGAATPASAPSFSRFNGINTQRVSSLVVVDNELVRVGVPDVELTIAGDSARGLSIATDVAFLNPLSSGSPATSPASATSSGRIFASSGSTLAQIDNDLGLLVQALIDGGSDLVNATWCLNTSSAVFLSKLRGSGGGLAFPSVNARGGNLMSLDVLTSGNILRAGSPSPGTSYLALVDASRIWRTSGDDIRFSSSRVASVEMVDGTTQDASSGTPATQTSMWQTESTALLATRYLAWQAAAGTGHAATLTNCEW
jgi:HK97 family phage major capsid protein